MLPDVFHVEIRRTWRNVEARHPRTPGRVTFESVRVLELLDALPMRLKDVGYVPIIHSIFDDRLRRVSEPVRFPFAVRRRASGDGRVHGSVLVAGKRGRLVFHFLQPARVLPATILLKNFTRLCRRRRLPLCGLPSSLGEHVASCAHFLEHSSRLLKRQNCLARSEAHGVHLLGDRLGVQSVPFARVLDKGGAHAFPARRAAVRERRRVDVSALWVGVRLG